MDREVKPHVGRCGASGTASGREPHNRDLPREGNYEQATEKMRSSTLTEDRKHPNHWYNRASDLHASAGALWHAMDDGEGEIAAELGLPSGFNMYTACHPVYYMLCGLALEVIMKAVLVQRGVPEKKYETHEFSRLTALLGVSPTKEEQALLRFYEASLVWAGRYPTPKRATDAELLEPPRFSRRPVGLSQAGLTCCSRLR